MTELYEVIFRGLKDKYGLDGMIPAYNRLRCAMDFDPNQKRDDEGKWTSEGGISKKQKNISEFLGKEYKGYKGQAAVEKLLKEKQGHIKAAFTRKDIGDIDLVWGDEAKGLCHLIKNRTKQGIDAKKFLDNLGEVIEKGKIYPNKYSLSRMDIWYKDKMAIVDTQYKDNKLTWVVTGFKQKNEPKR